jgi:ABC-type transport system involved in multi-copper enzyme maturation permease subunit
MSLPLLRKEAREHGPVLAATGVIGVAALFAILGVAEDAGGRFVGLARFLLTLGPLVALVLANRLLVREYTGRTQFFLETLPIGRARVFATKWLLGCVLMLLMAGFAWGVALRSARRVEVLASADAFGALWCAAAFCVAVWSFAALAGMLGRYRYLAWGGVALAALLAVNIAGIPFFGLPVIRLLGQDVQMATALPETSAFVYALVFAVLCAAGAAALALVGSGAMASTLAQRMTARERAFALVALIAVATISSTLEPKPVQPPFEITRGERFEGRWTRVGVLPSGTLDAASARSLARALADDSDALIDALDLPIHPPVFVLAQQGLDRHVMQRAALNAADGIVLKIAPNAPTENVRMLVAHSLVADATLGRAMKDDRHVLLDGLATYWPLRDDEAARERWWLRAAAIAEPQPADHLTAWAETSERLGECESLALAFSVFDTLEQRLGRDVTLESMKEIFVEPNDDVRVLLERQPATTLAAAGVDFGWLASAASAARERARERHAAELARRPVLAAAVDWRNTAGRGIEIETTLSGAPRYAAYYRTLSPWTTDAGDMPRLDVLDSRAVLPLSPSRNDRVLAVIEVDDEVLDCPVRVLAERLELQ